MQINRISFKNINNLKGEQAIDCSMAPLAHSGMFAIVGPTGSGKSTLLDVITLALFNRIPRFKKPMTKKEMEGSGSVMTRHTTDSFASIDFQIKDQLYTSRWEVSRTRTGTLKDYHMEIYHHGTAAFLDLKKSEVPRKNESIIGLDYDQFIKSIILSQGQFAKFLKADKNERGLLLENITGSSIYRRIGQKAWELNKKLREEIETFELRQADIELLDEASITELQNQITEAEKSVVSYDSLIKNLAEDKQTKQEILHQRQRHQQLQQAQQMITAQMDDFQSIERKLDFHDLSSPFRGKIAVYEMAAHQLNQVEGLILKSQSKIDQAKSQLKVVLQELSQLTDKEINEGNFKTEMKTFESAVITLDNDLKNITEQGTTIRLKTNKLVAEASPALKAKLSSSISPKEALLWIDGQVEDLPDDLSQDQDPDLYLLKLTQSLNEYRTRQKNLTQAAEWRLSLEENASKSKQKKEQSEQLSLKANELNELITKDKSALTKFQELLKKTQLQKLEAIKLFKLTDFRKELTKGEPCPLCGSTDHPFSEHDFESGEGYDLEIKKQENTIRELTSRLASNEPQHVKLITQSEQVEKELTELDHNIKSLNQQLSDHWTSISMEPMETEALHAELIMAGEQIQQMEKSLASVSQKKELAILREHYQQLESIALRYSSVHQERKTLFSGTDVSDVCNLLQDRFTDCTTSIVTHQQSITDGRMTKREEQKKLNITEKKLIPILSQLNLEKVIDLKNLILNDGEVNDIKQKKERLATQKTKTETELQTLQKSLSALINKDESELSLESVTIQLADYEKKNKELQTHIGTLKQKLTQDNANRERVSVFKKELDVLKENQKKWSLLNKMIGDATGNKFANFAQGLTLQNLVVLANKRLDQLSDRYLLIAPESDGLLQVIDLYQGETKRAVSTLSGGESFIVSLALALSLSDMASKNVALDSLFIDEGFGTLDAETLDMAMSTLEKLQTESQKTVGIISHVEALKDRIHTQIKLVKNAQGYSKIVLSD